MNKYNERRKKKFLKLAKETIMPFLEQTKEELAKKNILCDIYEDHTDSNPLCCIEIIQEYEKTAEGNRSQSDTPFYIDCDCKQTLNPFYKPVFISLSPGRLNQHFYLNQITKDFLAEQMNAFIINMKIKETKIITGQQSNEGESHD